LTFACPVPAAQIQKAWLQDFSVCAKDAGAFPQERTEVSRKQLLMKMARDSFVVFLWGFLRCELNISKE